MKKRILAMLLALVMVLSLLPATAMAIDDGICGRDAYWKFSPGTGTLTIYGSGPMYHYDTHGNYGEAPWYNVRSDVTSIVIEEGITTIGNLAFWGLLEVVEVSLPETLTEIGSEAFSRCSKLEEIYIPESVTRIGNGAFSSCSALSKANLPSGLEGVPNDSFSMCRNLTEIELHEGITFLASSCFEYTGISEFILPESLTQIVNRTFAFCPITEITIPANVYYLGSRIFAGCADLESVTFTGDAPRFQEDTFSGFRSSDDEPAIICYPPDNPTWTEEVMQTYGGNIVWRPTHVHSFATEVTPPTCTEQGYTTFTCAECGEVEVGEYVAASGHSYESWTVLQEPDCTSSGEEQGECQICGHVENRPILPLGHAFVDGSCSRCGTVQPKLNGVIRIAGADRIGTSLQLADQLKETLAIEKFNAVIVASALNFPDALTGSYLAAVKSAPILLTYEAAHPQIREYIQQNLMPGGMVYILGGESAVSADFVAELEERGIAFRRVAGDDRFGTNLAIMREAGVNADQPVLIATALNFADSLSASAAGLPMVLVYGSLREDQKEFLATTSRNFIIIGGTSAVSEDLEAELSAIGSVERLAGSGRYQTSVMVAEKFVNKLSLPTQETSPMVSAAAPWPMPWARL